MAGLEEDGEGETLRALPAALVEMEINVNLLSNMSWEYFAGRGEVVQADLLEEL